MLIFKLNEQHEKLLVEFSRVRVARGFNRGRGDSAPVLCREYLHFLENQGCEIVTQSHVFHYRKFCDYLKTRKKVRGKGFLSQTHLQHIRYAVHSFYEFLFEADYISSSPVSGSLFNHAPTQDKKIVSRKEILKIFSVAESLQEKALLALVYGCGLRRSEVARLKLGDYRPNASLLSVREGKYFKSRVIPVSEKMNQVLQEYINVFRLKVEARKENRFAFLLDQHGVAIDGEQAYQMVRKLARRSGLTKAPICLHMLRNSVAVHMLNRGADIEFVKRFLGHTLLDTTMLYATRRRKRISLKRRINAVAKYA